MIFNRLYELALCENLLDDLAFEELPIPYLVTVGEGGAYLGFGDIRGETTVESKKKGAPSKTARDKGRVVKVPRAHGNTANQGFARYFADTLPRALPLAVEAKDQKKADASRATFWEQIDHAADETDDPTLRALQQFGRRLPEFTDRIRADVAKTDAKMTDRVMFAYQPSGGKALLDEENVRGWYSAFYANTAAAKQGAGPVGICQVTGTVGPIPTSHTTKLQGVPGGMSVGVSLISFDKPAFGHYGLDGAVNAGIGYAATDGYLRALDALLKNNLPSVKAKGGKSRIVIGGTAFLYWSKERQADTKFMNLFDTPAAEPMEQLVGSVRSGKNAADALDVSPFYLLALSGNSARAIVRGYLETTLHDAKANVLRWFDDLRIADTSKDNSGAVNNKFSLKSLAAATIPLKQSKPDWDKLPDHVSEQLLTAALTGGPIPDSIVIACLQRLKVEGSKSFRGNRMALLKVALTRKARVMTQPHESDPGPGPNISEQLNPDERDPAYVFGRMLAVFDQIQYAALGAVNSNVVDKFYGTMSSAPGMIFGRLMENAQKHLKKLRTDGSDKKKKQAVFLDNYLTTLRSLLTAAPPKLQHSVQEQARFALGFYHEKAKRLERIAIAMAKKQSKA